MKTDTKKPRFKQGTKNQTFCGKPLELYLQQIGEKGVFISKEVLDGVDWQQFEEAYPGGGSSAYPPQTMLSQILYAILHGVSSLREIARFGKKDLACLWLTGGLTPDFSSLGRFITRHEDILTVEFFEDLTRQVMKRTGSSAARTAGDGTVIEAACSRFQLMKKEAAEKALAEARKVLEQGPPDSKAQQTLAQAEKVAEVMEERSAKRKAKSKDPEATQVARTETDAVVQPLKDKRMAASYKPSVLANEDRIILAQTVHPSSETAVVGELFEQGGRQGKIELSNLDGGYHCDEVIEQAKAHGIELNCPEGRGHKDGYDKQSDKLFLKNRFHYDAEQNTYTCPAGELLKQISDYKGNCNNKPYRTYATDACATCKQRTKCTKSKKGRRIKRYNSDPAKEQLREKLKDPEVRKQYKKRAGMVEPVFSFLRYRQGLTRFHRKGLKKVRCEFALHAAAYNLSRACALATVDAV